MSALLNTLIAFPEILFGATVRNVPEWVIGYLPDSAANELRILQSLSDTWYRARAQELVNTYNDGFDEWSELANQIEAGKDFGSPARNAQALQAANDLIAFLDRLKADLIEQGIAEDRSLRGLGGLGEISLGLAAVIGGTIVLGVAVYLYFNGERAKADGDAKRSQAKSYADYNAANPNRPPVPNPAVKPQGNSLFGDGGLVNIDLSTVVPVLGVLGALYVIANSSKGINSLLPART